MKVEYFIIKDIKLDGSEHSEEEIAANKKLREEVRKKRYAVTSLCPGDGLGKMYLGCTNTAGDILYEFDVKKNKMRCLNFQQVAEPFDAKIHRGLWLDRKRNSLYFGLATLTSTSKVALCPGAGVMRFDLKSEKYQELGRPSPGSYIQATSYDAERQMIYSFTLPMLGFAVSELKTGKVRWNIPLESIVHVATIDPAGGVWGTWGITDQAFFRYDPDKNSFDFPEDCRMPTACEACNVMYTGAGPVDCMLTGPDGMIYVGSAIGEIYRLNPQTKEVTYLARPAPYNRLPGLTFGPDGRLYGVGGDKAHVVLFAYDLKKRAVEVFGELAAEDGRRCFRPHDLAFQDGRFFVGETDNPRQSGCLWACTV